MQQATSNRNAKQSRTRVALHRGVSLVEILFVVAILGIVAVGAVTLFEPDLVNELENAADVVVADVERARNLAVANNSQYKFTFNTDGSGYFFKHSGTNTALNTLPASPYSQRSDAADRQTTLLKELPGLRNVDLIGAVQVAGSVREQVADLEFSSAGATSRSQATEIWLAAGSGTSRRYRVVTVNPTTGLANVGAIAGALPTIGAGTSGS